MLQQSCSPVVQQPTSFFYAFGIDAECHCVWTPPMAIRIANATLGCVNLLSAVGNAPGGQAAFDTITFFP